MDYLLIVERILVLANIQIRISIELGLLNSHNPHPVLRIVGRTVLQESARIPAIFSIAHKTLFESLDVIYTTNLTSKLNTALEKNLLEQ